MTTQQIMTDVLRGWHAAERGDLFDFRETGEWKRGHMLWSDNHCQPKALVKLLSTHSAPPTDGPKDTGRP
mgnify:CR=1 FL=1